MTNRHTALVFTLPLLLLAACGPVEDPNGTGDGSGGACGAAGPTEHRGTIAADETWSAAGSPHLLTENVIVAQGATLTIEPCAQVLAASGVRLTVRGRLVAEGTSEAPIAFGASEADRWGPLLVDTAGTARLAHATLTDGGFDDRSYHGASIVVKGDGTAPVDPAISVEDVTISGSAGEGMWLRDAAAFTADSTGLRIEGSGADATFSGRPVKIEALAVSTLPPGTYTGNRDDRIEVHAFQWLETDTEIHDPGVPYYVFQNPLRIVRASDADPIPTLTLDAGVEIQFEKSNDTNSPGIVVGMDVGREGALVVDGTAEKPVVLTSGAASPAPGDWQDITFKAPTPGMNRIDHAVIEYAGSDCACDGYDCPAKVDGSGQLAAEDGAVRFHWQPDSELITNTTFRHIAGWGVVRGWDGSSAPDFTATNTFEDLLYCPQSQPRDANGQCAADPYVCSSI